MSFLDDLLTYYKLGRRDLMEIAGATALSGSALVSSSGCGLFIELGAEAIINNVMGPVYYTEENDGTLIGFRHKEGDNLPLVSYFHSFRGSPIQAFPVYAALDALTSEKYGKIFPKLTVFLPGHESDPNIPGVTIYKSDMYKTGELTMERIVETNHNIATSLGYKEIMLGGFSFGAATGVEHYTQEDFDVL